MLCETCFTLMEVGYGLYGGGIGPYFFCETCGAFEKFSEEGATDAPQDIDHGTDRDYPGG